MNTKRFDPNKNKIDEEPYKCTPIYYIGCVTIKDSEYVKNYSINSLYHIFNKLKRYFEEINGNKCSTLDPTNESKEK